MGPTLIKAIIAICYCSTIEYILSLGICILLHANRLDHKQNINNVLTRNAVPIYCELYHAMHVILQRESSKWHVQFASLLKREQARKLVIEQYKDSGGFLNLYRAVIGQIGLWMRICHTYE